MSDLPDPQRPVVGLYTTDQISAALDSTLETQLMEAAAALGLSLGHVMVGPGQWRDSADPVVLKASLVGADEALSDAREELGMSEGALKDAEAEIDRLRAEIHQRDSAVAFEVSCLGCAATLDGAAREAHRAEAAETRVADLERLERYVLVLRAENARIRELDLLASRTRTAEAAVARVRVALDEVSRETAARAKHPFGGEIGEAVRAGMARVVCDVRDALDAETATLQPPTDSSRRSEASRIGHGSATGDDDWLGREIQAHNNRQLHGLLGVGDAEPDTAARALAHVREILAAGDTSGASPNLTVGLIASAVRKAKPDSLEAIRARAAELYLRAYGEPYAPPSPVGYLTLVSFATGGEGIDGASFHPGRDQAAEHMRACATDPDEAYRLGAVWPADAPTGPVRVLLDRGDAPTDVDTSARHTSKAADHLNLEVTASSQLAGAPAALPLTCGHVYLASVGDAVDYAARLPCWACRQFLPVADWPFDGDRPSGTEES